MFPFLLSHRTDRGGVDHENVLHSQGRAALPDGLSQKFAAERMLRASGGPRRQTEFEDPSVRWDLTHQQPAT